MKQKKQIGNIILKQLTLILVIFISIFLAALVGQFINEYINYNGFYVYPILSSILNYSNLEIFGTALQVTLYFVLYIYIGVVLLTSINIEYLRKFKYNYFYIFLATFLFILLPYNLESTFATYIAYFLEPSEGLIVWYILLFPILLLIKGLLLLLVLAWIFKKIKRNTKRK